jgi:DNA sulfur modification protein DndE
MHSAVPAAQIKIATAKTARRKTSINNWSLYIHPGSYQINYLERAAAARSGVAAALAEDLVCFYTAIDQTGEPLTGAKQYVIHFSQDLTPPVGAFWSITMYDSRDRLVPNNINRHVIGDRDRLRLNPDNSLSIYVQHNWPGAEKDSNWLPAPKDRFNLALRMYWPKLDVLAEGWRPPAVTPGNWG